MSVITLRYLYLLSGLPMLQEIKYWSQKHYYDYTAQESVVWGYLNCTCRLAFDCMQLFAQVNLSVWSSTPSLSPTLEPWTRTKRTCFSLWVFIHFSSNYSTLLCFVPLKLATFPPTKTRLWIEVSQMIALSDVQNEHHDITQEDMF